MLPQFAQRHGSALQIDRFEPGTSVLARIRVLPDVSSRIADLRTLAQRYNAQFEQRGPSLRIAN